MLMLGYSLFDAGYVRFEGQPLPTPDLACIALIGRNWKDLEGSGRDLIEVLSRIFLEKWEKT
jgi:hypothetical protein